MAVRVADSRCAETQTPGTRDEHLQACFLALTHSLMPEKVPNRGTAAQPIPGVPVPNSGRSAPSVNCAYPRCQEERSDTDLDRQAAAR